MDRQTTHPTHPATNLNPDEDQIHITRHLAERIGWFSSEVKRVPGERTEKRAERLAELIVAEFEVRPRYPKVTRLPQRQLEQAGQARLPEPIAPPVATIPADDRTDADRELCPRCLGSGEICIHCSWPRSSCVCRVQSGARPVSDFDPVVCTECGGKRFVD